MVRYLVFQDSVSTHTHAHTDTYTHTKKDNMAQNFRTEGKK